MRRVVTAGTALAVAGAAHAAVNARLLRRPAPRDGSLPSVSVLVPARDEAANIATCLRALLAQDMPIELIVLDDGSSDATAAIARGLGVRVLDGAPLPARWLGKPWACAQLAAAASGEVLVFVDADVCLRPSAVRAAVALLADTGLDLVSPHPRQIAITPAERLVQPLLQWSFLTTLPLRLAEKSARPSLAAANGQFLVVRRVALECAGGLVPTLVIVGDHEAPFIAVAADSLARWIPGAKKVVIPNAGHGAHFAQPASFNSALQDFIYSVERNKPKK